MYDMKKSDKNVGDRDNVTKCNFETVKFTVDEMIELREILKVKSKLIKLTNNNSDSNSDVEFEDLKPRTLFISQKIFKEFKKFTKDNKSTLKNTVTIALIEYMNNYNNK